MPARGIVVLADRQLLRVVRAAHPQRMILIMLGAEERACAPGLLDEGADAVIVGRSRERELIARVRALMRRDGPDPKLRRSGGAPIGRAELALLALLAADPGCVVSKRALIDAGWEDDPPPGAARTIERRIARLRRALDSSGLTLVTVWGVGYRLQRSP